MARRIIDAVWFTGRPPCQNAVTGAVLLELDDGSVKGYLGSVIGGFSEDMDMLNIAQVGSKLPPTVVAALFPNSTKAKTVIY
jgi:hypothetical protein